MQLPGHRGLGLRLTALGFATAFVGLVVIMRWLADACWHAYRDTLDASSWPPLQ